LSPPSNEEVRKKMVQQLVNSNAQNQGDSFIRLLLKHPDQFHVHGDVTKAVLRAYYSFLWDASTVNDSSSVNSQLELQVLEGASNPKAFVEVHVENGKCLEDAVSVAPVLSLANLNLKANQSQNQRKQQLFVLYSDVVQAKRKVM